MKRFLFAMSLCLMCQLWATDFAGIPKLSVKGEASVLQPADQMEVSLGVATTGENSSVALNENNQRIHQIIDNLHMLGLDETDYKTGRFHIQPIYEKNSSDPKENMHSKIIRYDVLNSIQIKTQKIALADKIIAAAVQGGANQMEGLNFNLNNPQTYRTDVIKIAMQNALANAFNLADAAGIKVKRILNLSLDQWQPAPMMFSKQMVSGHEGRGQLIAEGKVEIHATVNVTFEIDENTK